jgi:hypothetical protein
MAYTPLTPEHDMTIPEILKKLEPYTGKFPRPAMQAAIEQREAITPELLRVLESVAADPAEWARRTDNMLPTFAIFLLAQFREKRAYSLLVKTVTAPGEIPFDLFGDTITETLNRSWLRFTTAIRRRCAAWWRTDR